MCDGFYKHVCLLSVCVLHCGAGLCQLVLSGNMQLCNFVVDFPMGN